MIRSLAVSILLLGSASSASAQMKLRPIDAPSGTEWTHGQTRINLPPVLAGLARVQIGDTGQGELDVVASYVSADRQVQATVYIFRPQIADAALWFDRALTIMLNRRDYALSPTERAAIGPFTPAGAAGPSGLKATVLTAGSHYGATGVAVAGIDGWIVKIRLSVVDRDQTVLEERLDRFIAALKLPGVVGADSVRPIEACAQPLTYKKAKPLRPDGAQTLLNALSDAVAASSTAAKANVTYCRDISPQPLFGVYRAGATTNAYVLALADAGRAITAGAGLAVSGGRRFSINYLELDQTMSYSDFNNLPSPAQVSEHVNSARPLSSSSLDGKAITVDQAGLK